MKLLRSLAVISMLCIGMQFHATAQEAVIEKEKFKVWGNCEMCKSQIEAAASAVDGVASARWNPENRKMSVKFDTEKTSVEAIQDAIAAVGYDTETQKAPDEVYKKLHHCCQYDRKQD